MVHGDRFLSKILVSVALATALIPGVSLAQAYPDRPLKLIVGFPPGTPPDFVARLLGQKISENLQQPVVVDNRAGAGGQIATLNAVNSPGDGYTLLLAEVGSISIAPATFSKLPYDPAKQLIPLTEVTRSDFVLVVSATSSSNTIKDFMERSKSAKDRINFATFGTGTPGHFGAEILAAAGGFRAEPIHFRQSGEALAALLSGDAEAAFVTTALAAPQVKAGKLKALASSGKTRSTQLPRVPTFAESGLPGIEFSAWSALFVPAGTPEPLLERLSREIAAAMHSPEVKSKIEESGVTVTGTSRADTTRMVKDEAKRWAEVVRQTGFKID